MSVGRFVLGALLGGIVLNVTGILLAHFFLGEFVRVMIERVGAFPAWAPIAHLTMRLAFATVGLAIWAFVRGRVAGRAASVTLSAAFVWILTTPAPLEIWHVHAGLAGRDLLLAALWGFAEIWLAILVGSWIAAPRASRVAAGVAPGEPGP